MIKLTQLINELELTDDMRIHMSKKPFELEPRTLHKELHSNQVDFGMDSAVNGLIGVEMRLQNGQANTFMTLTLVILMYYK